MAVICATTFENAKSCVMHIYVKKQNFIIGKASFVVIFHEAFLLRLSFIKYIFLSE